MKAFTLAETMVVIAVTSVVGIALISLITNFYRSDEYLLEQTSAIDSAHVGLSSAFTELREASYGEDGSYPITSAGTSTITFYSDVNGDGNVEKVHLYIQGTTLYIGLTSATGTPPTYVGQTEKVATVAPNLRNPTSTPLFLYYDDTGTQLSTTSPNVADIASIATDLIIDLNPNRAPAPFTLTETATLRNLRSN